MNNAIRQKTGFVCCLTLSFLLMFAVTWNLGFSQEPSQANTAKQSLERLNDLIGEWRGTGQVRRGSTRGAWRQTGEFVWDFSKKTPAVKYVVDNGKLTESGFITWNENDKYRLELTDSKEETRVYTGDWSGKKLLLTSKANDQDIRYRITVTPLNEKRSLVLHEKTSSGGASFFRIAEVGYTRAGTRLAIPGGGKRECVVTGGTAQTAVTFEGETYYVCCSGCKQAFDDDPAGVIADFKARLKERAEKFKE